MFISSNADQSSALFTTSCPSVAAVCVSPHTSHPERLLELCLRSSRAHLHKRCLLPLLSMVGGVHPLPALKRFVCAVLFSLPPVLINGLTSLDFGIRKVQYYDKTLANFGKVLDMLPYICLRATSLKSLDQPRTAVRIHPTFRHSLADVTLDRRQTRHGLTSRSGDFSSWEGVFSRWDHANVAFGSVLHVYSTQR